MAAALTRSPPLRFAPTAAFPHPRKGELMAVLSCQHLALWTPWHGRKSRCGCGSEAKLKKRSTIRPLSMIGAFAICGHCEMGPRKSMRRSRSA